MDYLKFNCHDMAVQNNELYEAHSKMQALNNELADVMRALDPQIKSYEGLQNHLSTFQAAASGIAVRVLTMADALDQIVDVYYSAENRALQATESLPVRSVQQESKTSAFNVPPTAASAIQSSDLVLEDWLAELVYKYGKDEING